MGKYTNDAKELLQLVGFDLITSSSAQAEAAGV